MCSTTLPNMGSSVLPCHTCILLLILTWILLPFLPCNTCVLPLFLTWILLPFLPCNTCGLLLSPLVTHVFSSFPHQELPLQPCYSISDISMQQYDQFGKIHTMKVSPYHGTHYIDTLIGRYTILDPAHIHTDTLVDKLRTAHLIVIACRVGS